MKNRINPTQREIQLGDQDFIVSKTDLKGRITYANRIFMHISGYREDELLGVQHNILRHPDMPRAIFKLLWDYIQSGRECFAYTKNLCKNGDHYWVLANVTPDTETSGQASGYFSVRRRPRTEAVHYFSNLYARMLEAEQQAGPREAIAASTALLENEITQKGFKDYETF
ncbi:MAG: PAS domain S-box protein, partial [Gammaproteobacteria bacterium]